MPSCLSFSMPTRIMSFYYFMGVCKHKNQRTNSLLYEPNLSYHALKNNLILICLFIYDI